MVSGSIMEQFLSSNTNYLFAALERDEPVGYAMAYRLPRLDRPRSMLYLHDIAVLPAWRGQGVGRQLMNAVREFCRSESFLKLFMITDHGNDAARRLYAGTGGTPSQDQVLFVYDFDESL